MRRSDYYTHSESQGSSVLLWLGGSALVVALGMSIMLYTPLMDIAGQYAGVGMYAEVPSNEFNTLAQELSEKERELAIRESMIARREADVRNRFVDTRDGRELLYVSIFGLVLFGLIAMNFILDIRRSRQSRLRPVIKL